MAVTRSLRWRSTSPVADARRRRLRPRERRRHRLPAHPEVRLAPGPSSPITRLFQNQFPCQATAYSPTQWAVLTRILVAQRINLINTIQVPTLGPRCQMFQMPSTMVPLFTSRQPTQCTYSVALTAPSPQAPRLRSMTLRLVAGRLALICPERGISRLRHTTAVTTKSTSPVVLIPILLKRIRLGNTTHLLILGTLRGRLFLRRWAAPDTAL